MSGTQRVLSVDELIEAARRPVLPAEIRQRAPRYGDLGRCVACDQPALTHFDMRGQFLGCQDAGDETTFVLVPREMLEGLQARVEAKSGARRSGKPIAAAAPRKRHYKAVYGLAVPEETPVTSLGLRGERYVPIVQTVLDAALAGRKLTCKEIEEKLHLPHSSASQALTTLVKRGILTAEEYDQTVHKK